jgi:carboxyl-terminal processing protease
VAPAHGLDDLSVLETVLFQVEESYVDPARVNYEEMFVAALQAVEQSIPVCAFRREGRVLQMEVGQYRTVVEVARVGSRRDLQAALQDVAVRLARNLDPSDIPGQWLNPYIRIEYVLVNGVLSTLDPHSVLLVPEEAREMDIDNDGEYGGIGIIVSEEQGRLVVERVRPGDPGERAGIQVGDYLARVNGVSTMGVAMIDALQDIRGVPGSSLTLEVRRLGSPPLTLTVVRDVIAPDAVHGEWLGNGVFYLSIPAFHDDVYTGLRAELDRAVKEQGTIKGIVLDLRGNPGGYLSEAVAVSNAFLAEGTILSTVGAGNRREPPHRARRRGTEPAYPLAVLVDADSASASEIVAGALRNNERAVIIGERSFGKGSVQNLWDFPDGSKLKLTVGKYLTPGEISIQAVGIPADIETVPVVIDPTSDPADIRVLWREGVRREADLDRRFDRVDERPTDPAFTMPYLRLSEVDRLPDGRINPHTDPEVALAQAVVSGARSSSRSEILAAVAPLVEREHLQHERGIVAALADLGVDWSFGPVASPESARAWVELPDGDLVAGQATTLRIGLENVGPTPLSRAVVIVDADMPELEGLEAVFGRLQPGERMVRDRTVIVPPGYGSAHLPVELLVRDGHGDLGAQSAVVPVHASGSPAFNWMWSWQDLGDGDGIPQVGESWAVDVEVHNVGVGSTVEPFVRLSGARDSGVELQLAYRSPGRAQRPDGSACVIETPGWDGDVFVGGEVTGEPGFDVVNYAAPCRHVLAPGEMSTERLLFTVTQPIIGDVPLVLTVGDVQNYDVGAVDEAGLWRTFANRMTLWLSADGALSSGEAVPPVVSTTAAPPLTTSSPTVTVSGLAQDASGIAYVAVFADDDKVFLDAADRARPIVSTVPFTATVALEPGMHRLTIVAADLDGLTRTQTHRVWVTPTAQASR